MASALRDGAERPDHSEARSPAMSPSLIHILHATALTTAQRRRRRHNQS
jgi:hypothetical protein